MMLVVSSNFKQMTKNYHLAWTKRFHELNFGLLAVVHFWIESDLAEMLSVFKNQTYPFQKCYKKKANGLF